MDGQGVTGGVSNGSTWSPEGEGVDGRSDPGRGVRTSDRCGGHMPYWPCWSLGRESARLDHKSTLLSFRGSLLEPHRHHRRRRH